MSTAVEPKTLSHLRQLEAESIFILREVAAEFKNPVMLYSVGKDSSVMLRLAQKAFAPGKIPFPLLHVDTGYKFPEMYEFRDQLMKKLGIKLLVERNEEAIAAGSSPFKYGVQKCCGLLKTQGLLDGLTKYGFDAAFGGARREEEKSRAKERVYSFRDSFGQWDPKNQRPELWDLYNSKINEGESIRVFPLSNWTELDIWLYIEMESIPVVPIYFTHTRKIIRRKDLLIPFAPHIPILPGDEVGDARVRFRSLGCMSCTGAVRSDKEVSDLRGIIEDLITTRKSERENRIIDHGSDSSMEQKKKEGYF
ncbi:MAG: sulfate adenylyltransferase subunit CysD [bacterium]